MKDELIVFSDNDTDRRRVRNILTELFSEWLDVVELSSATARSYARTPKAVVYSSSNAYNVGEFFPRSTLVYTQRTIDGKGLEKLVELPVGTRVLVANHPEKVAREMTQNLIALGITHLVPRPYWPGCEEDTEGYETVVYAGFRQYCPEGKKTYIDIGYRSLTQSTLAKIIKAFDLPTDCVNTSHERHISLLVNGLYKTQKAYNETLKLQQILRSVCDLSSNAILNLEGGGRIVVCNPAAELLLQLREQEVLNRHYQEVLDKHKGLLRLIDGGVEVREEVLYIRKQPVMATLHLIFIDGARHISVSLTPVNALQDTEERARAGIYQSGLVAKYTFDDIVGREPSIRRAVAVAKLCAANDDTVLITGESGTGKEMFAQSIHNASARARGPFVGANFAAIPESLIESELFGYEEGSFTGAAKGGKQGLFRLAHKGTLFLDEIGDTSSTMQSKLLRVLEEREVMPVGSSRVIPVDVRVLCATNKDLCGEIKGRRFREDLYYRLKGFIIHLPPLRERRGDIPALLRSILGDRFTEIPPSICRQIMAYQWPGNIRELVSLSRFLSQIGKLGQGEERDVYEDLIQRFFLSGMPNPAPPDEVDLCLLCCIHELTAQNRTAGRYSLANMRQVLELGLSEFQVKIRLKGLEERGLIAVGRTRQGVTLTGKGWRVLGER